MALISDKARFHIEQGVPELREWERRELFTREEIASIARQRSDFEHILAGRGSTPRDYARYVEFESNVAALVRKRVQRKRVKATAHTGQKRILNILDRGTKKWHGDIGLWMQYLEYCRSQRANKRLQRVMTETLRLFPTSPTVWMWASRWFFDVPGDMMQTRSTLQRGLRFCPNSWELYLEYANMELRYLTKIAARRHILGLDDRRAAEIAPPDEDETDALDRDTIALPSVTAGEAGIIELENTSAETIRSSQHTRHKSDSPLMSGAIPLAIFDAAMKQSGSDMDLAAQFYSLFAIHVLPCTGRLADRVLATLRSIGPDEPSTIACICRRPLVTATRNTAEYFDAVQESVALVNAAISEKRQDQPDIARSILFWMEPLSKDQETEPEIKQVAQAMARRLDRLVDTRTTALVA